MLEAGGDCVQRGAVNLQVAQRGDTWLECGELWKWTTSALLRREEEHQGAETTSCSLKLPIYGWNGGKNVEWKRERSVSEIHFQCSQYDGIFWNSNDMPIRFCANNMHAWNTRKFPPDESRDAPRREWKWQQCPPVCPGMMSDVRCLFF